MYENKTINT